jgi:hypothetical protein
MIRDEFGEEGAPRADAEGKHSVVAEIGLKNQERIQNLEQELQNSTNDLRLKTQRVGQYDLPQRNAYFFWFYTYFILQFLFTMALVYAWINVYNLQHSFKVNPIPLLFALVVTLTIAGCFFCNFKSWTLLSVVSINLCFSLLVSLGVVYSDSTFLLECMGLIALYSFLLMLLNAQHKCLYSPGVIIVLTLLGTLLAIWYFVYMPATQEFSNVANVLDTPGYRLERLLGLIFTVFVCCIYILHFEQQVQEQYLLQTELEASVHLYVHTLFFIYVLAQIVHLWTVRLRRCRRGVSAGMEEF